MAERGRSLAALSDAQCDLALARYAVLRAYLEEGVPLPRTAAAGGVPLRRTQRWLAR